MKLALFDIDGVLANDQHRVQHALDRKWPAYFDPKAMAADPVWEQGRSAVEDARAKGYTIGYMTGRRDDRRTLTEDWLAENRFPFGRVIMREFGEHEPLANLKTKKIQKLVSQNQFSHVVLFDDDPEVIRLVHEQVGVDNAVHCTWHVKEKALVKMATV